MTYKNAPPPEKKHFLQGLDLFEDLDERGLERVANAAIRRKVAADAFLLYQGDPATHMYVILSGRLKLTQVTVEGQQVLLRYANPGEALVILAVLSDMVYPISAEAVEDSQVAGWDKEAMQQLMLQYPAIARTLLRLARQTGRKVKEGVLLDLPISRQDLAEMTGTTLYTVSRTLSQWETQGLIRSGREKIVILFPHGLVSIAEDLPFGLSGPNDLDE
jgi:CRP/FNR family transcriptional regulator, nitrogen oxide reductase regulator